VRALVTGATGFIGSHLVELLLDQGWEVVCPVRNINNLKHLNGINISLIPYDSLEHEIEKGPELDYVIHAAGATRAPNYTAFRSANVELTERILDVVSNTHASHSIKKFVLISSQAVAGPSQDSETPVRESDTPNPISLYGRTKLEAEQVTTRYQYLLPITIIRPSTVFGPRDRDVLGVFRSARYRLAPYIAGPDRWISIIYVEDLTKGILAATTSPYSVGETYFLANPEPIIWREFALQVAHTMRDKALPMPIPLFLLKIMATGGDFVGHITGSTPLFNSEKLKEAKQIAWICSTEKAYHDLQWSPQFDINLAIYETFTWYKENGWL
jgi:nucleoside-diphosphate-sugar epimerase